jgi:hypothetical protein
MSDGLWNYLAGPISRQPPVLRLWIHFQISSPTVNVRLIAAAIGF